MRVTWGIDLARKAILLFAIVNAALFGIFYSEMLYATTAHVANDWLAVAGVMLFQSRLKIRRARSYHTD